MSYHAENNHYQNGRLAFLDGKESNANPHKRYTTERNEWALGWYEAKQDWGTPPKKK